MMEESISWIDTVINEVKTERVEPQKAESLRL